MTTPNESHQSSEEERSVLGCRVGDETQSAFAEFVEENMGNRRGAYGYAVERAMREYMDNDRYARVEDRLSDLESTVKHTNALVRRIVTAEKEKGAFLEPADTGNSVGSRRERENAVIEELVRKCRLDGHGREYSEKELYQTIVEVADVSSQPSKRSYKESMMDRGMLEPQYGTYELTDSAFALAGFEQA